MKKKFKKSSRIVENEILEDSIYINNIEYLRYYHNNEIPTNYFVSFYGDVYSYINDIILKPNKTKKGYYKVGIFIDGKVKSVTCHKMVGICYHSDKYHKSLDIDHKDGNKLNNRADNLEWVTRQENIRRAFNNGLKKAAKGDKHPATVYKDADIIKACELISNGSSIIDVSDELNIPKSYLYTILRGESRNDIVSKYNFDKSIYSLIIDPIPKEKQEIIRKLYFHNKYKPVEIMKKLNIDKNERNKVYNIIHRKY